MKLKVDSKKMKKALSISGNEITRIILRVLDANTALTFSEIQQQVNNTQKRAKASNHIAYNIKELKDTFMIRKDQKTNYYYLTRMGLKLYNLVKEFESAYTVYDIKDVKADGTLKQTIVIENRMQLVTKEEV